MKDVLINFEREKLEGIVAVGSYLSDAAKRLGVEVTCDCLDEEVETSGSCVMKITKGKPLLSEPTKLELELLTDAARKKGERLACQTKIEKSGEINIMTTEKKVVEEEKAEEEVHQEEYKKNFEELPLEKKISNLMELEAIALSETFSFVMNSPYKAVGKVMDVLAGFGLQMEQEDSKAKRPDEHIKEDEPTDKTDAKKEKEEVKEKAEAEDQAKSKKTSATAKKKTASKTTTAKRKPAAKKTTGKKTGTTKKKEEDK